MTGKDKQDEGGAGIVLRTHPRGVAALVVLTAALTFASTAQAETRPPRGYANGSELQQGTRQAIIAWGKITLNSSVLGKVNCLNTFFAEGWNQHEHLEASKPIRGYGEVLGWGNSSCEAPEEINSLTIAHEEEIKAGKIEVPITVTATAEMPLEKTGRFAEICKVPTKTIEQCNAKEGNTYTERETKLLTNEFHRRVVTLPWKVELINGERREEEGTLQKIGIHEFGETGTAVAHTTKCYPKEGEKPASFKVLPLGCVGVNILFPQIPAEFIYYGTQEIWGINGVHNGLTPSKIEWVNPAGSLFSSEGLEGEGTTTGKVAIAGAPATELLTAK